MASGRRLSVNPKARAAAAIAQAQADLEGAVEALDRLPSLDVHSIALAAHALNTFLSVSQGVVALLLPLLRNHPSRQVTVWLEGLSHANDLMTHTVSQLMNGAVDVEPTLHLEDVDLRRLVERACAYYRRPADRKGISVSFTVTADPPTIRTDRVLVAAVLDNLLSNAVKHSPHDRHIWVDVHGASDGVVCEVQDEGPELTAAERELVFTPGVRQAPTSSDGEHAGGYGLAVAKSFVDRLGGELTCTSPSAGGTTFSFWLPGRGPKV